MADTGSISQDTITKSGLAPSDLAYGDIMRSYGQRDQALTDSQESAKKISGMQSDKATALAPKMDEAAKVAAAPPPTAPPQEKAPDYKRPTVDPKEMQESFGLLLATSMLVGIGSRDPFFGAMTGMTGAIKGYQAKDEQLVKDSMQAFDRNLAAIKERNDAARRDFDVAWKKYSTDLPRLNQEIQILSAKYDMPIAAEQANRGAIEDRIKALDNQIKSGQTAYQKAQELSEKIRHNIEAEEARKTAAANAAQAHKDNIDLRRDMAGLGQAAPVNDGSPAAGVEAATYDYLIKGTHPPVRGGIYQNVMKNVEDIAKKNNMTPQELISASADVKTQLMAKKTFETRVQNLSRAENQLQLEIPVMEEAMKKLDLPSIPLAARGNIWMLRQMGNPAVVQLDQAAETVFREFEGIVTGNPGTLNVQDVVNAHNDYQAAQTPQTMKAAIDGMHRIITNAKKANDKTRAEIMGGINDSLKGKKPASGESAPASNIDSLLDKYAPK